MSFAVTTGSSAECTFGTAPGELIADFDTGLLVDGSIALTIDMVVAEVNITSFGVCAVTEVACVPVVVDTWTPGSVTASETGLGYVNDTSICNCSMGGVISIVDALGVTMLAP